MKGERRPKRVRIGTMSSSQAREIDGKVAESGSRPCGVGFRDLTDFFAADTRALGWVGEAC